MNSNQHSAQSRLTLPNLLTGFRFVAAPVLLWLAWHGHGIAFMILLAVAFLSDMLDGLAARLTGQVTQFGATLDSWADVINYLT
ncbi:MAG: CDP-alcohol phosphatidyltransferase family protein, partial [Methylobacter sp.]